MTRLRVIFFGLSLLVLSPTALADTLVVGGETRSYVVDGAGEAPRPLILALHGGGGSAKRFRKSNGLREEALAQGFAVVWPDSDGGNWNDGRVNRRGRLVSDADDSTFLLALVTKLVKQGIANPEQVYITGHSNGGMMSFAMGCQHPRVFKAMAPVSANIPEPMNCLGQGPVAALNITGQKDRVVPAEGGGIFGRTRRGVLKSVDETWAILRARNACQTERQSQTAAGLSLSGVGCRAQTRQLRLAGQGHSFPDDAARWIVAFFKSN